MTTSTGTVDPSVVEAVRERLSVVVGRPELRHRKLGRADPATIALTLPHRVYALGVNELAEGLPLRRARPVAEAFLVLDGEAVVAAAEVSPEGHVTISEGSAIDALAGTVEQVDADPDVGTEGAEVRVLRVPEVNLLALWLHRPGGDGDLIVPVARPPAPVQAGRRYDPDELSAVLVDVGHRHLRPPESGN